MTKYSTYTRKNSIRLKNYDYSKQGLYFMTVSNVENGNMIWSPDGMPNWKINSAI
jgi:hypothetical protein